VTILVSALVASTSKNHAHPEKYNGVHKKIVKNSPLCASIKTRHHQKRVMILLWGQNQTDTCKQATFTKWKRRFKNAEIAMINCKETMIERDMRRFTCIITAMVEQVICHQLLFITIPPIILLHPTVNLNPTVFLYMTAHLALTGIRPMKFMKKLGWNLIGVGRQNQYQKRLELQYLNHQKRKRRFLKSSAKKVTIRTGRTLSLEWQFCGTRKKSSWRVKKSRINDLKSQIDAVVTNQINHTLKLVNVVLAEINPRIRITKALSQFMHHQLRLCKHPQQVVAPYNLPKRSHL